MLMKFKISTLTTHLWLDAIDNQKFVDCLKQFRLLISRFRFPTSDFQLLPNARRAATTLALCLLILGPFAGYGQRELKPCGNSSEISDWLIRYQRNPEQYARPEGIVYAPLTIHIVGETNGAGYISIHQLMDAFCTLNSDFEPSGIQFFIAGELNYIDNSDWYSYGAFSTGAQMMAAHRVENTLNCYIVGDLMENCGYASGAGTALDKNCLFPDDHTWAHEIGHMLSLPHTFRGWEGYEHLYAEPAPAFINDRPVEKTDGSNCHFAGDRFCDTPPDYLNFRWSCNEDSESIQEQHDPDGVSFRSDGTFIMSYSNDECANRFSGEQIGAMQASLMDEWASLAFGSNLPGDIPDAPITLTAPVGGAIAPGGAEVVLSWEAVPNATHYIVEVARLPDIPFTVAKQTVTTNSATITGLQAGKRHYWRIRPYNPRFTCTAFSPVEQFITEDALAVSQPGYLSYLEAYPNPLPSGQGLRVDIQAPQPFDARIGLFSATGARVKDWGRHPVREGEQVMEFSAEGVAAGLYLLQVDTPGGRVLEKIVVNPK